MDRSLAVNRLSKRVYDTPEHSVSDRHLYYSARGLYDISLANAVAAAEKYRADIVFLQVQDHAVYIARELQQLALHGIFQAVYTCNTVSYLDNSTCI